MQVRSESNTQPAVLETAALPVELRTCRASTQGHSSNGQRLLAESQIPVTSFWIPCDWCASAPSDRTFSVPAVQHPEFPFRFGNSWHRNQYIQAKHILASHAPHQTDRFTSSFLEVNRSFPGSNYQAKIFVTTPDPTVRPPSRMAKRSFSSMAIGESGNNSMVILTLSPGIHICTPSGRVQVPVTSVVRK